MGEKQDNIIIMCSDLNVAETKGIMVFCLGEGCNKKIWLSDSSIPTIRNQYPDIDLVKNPPVTLCMNCCFKSMSKKKDFRIMKPSTEQLREIIDAVMKKY